MRTDVFFELIAELNEIGHVLIPILAVPYFVEKATKYEYKINGGAYKYGHDETGEVIIGQYFYK